MNLLAIETSTTCASIALVTPQVRLVRTQQGVSEHARMLLPSVDALLQEGGVDLDALDGIVFGQGPGSFTGLRIACCIARGLAFARDLPLYPVCTLAAIAAQASAPASTLVLMDARMGELYHAYFEDRYRHGGVFLSKPEAIEVPSETALHVAGCGFEPWLDRLPPSVRSRIVHVEPCFPSALAMIDLVRCGKVEKVPMDEALPVYIRDNVTQGDSRG